VKEKDLKIETLKQLEKKQKPTTVKERAIGIKDETIKSLNHRLEQKQNELNNFQQTLLQLQVLIDNKNHTIHAMELEKDALESWITDNAHMLAEKVTEISIGKLKHVIEDST